MLRQKQAIHAWRDNARRGRFSGVSGMMAHLSISKAWFDCTLALKSFSENRRALELLNQVQNFD
jgi:hypothetical protein